MPELAGGVFFEEGFRPAVTVSMVGRGKSDWPDGLLFPGGGLPPLAGFGSEPLSPGLLIAAFLVLLGQTLAKLHVEVRHWEDRLVLTRVLLALGLILWLSPWIVHTLWRRLRRLPLRRSQRR